MKGEEGRRRHEKAEEGAGDGRPRTADGQDVKEQRRGA